MFNTIRSKLGLDSSTKQYVDEETAKTFGSSRRGCTTTAPFDAAPP